MYSFKAAQDESLNELNSPRKSMNGAFLLKWEGGVFKYIYNIIMLQYRYNILDKVLPPKINLFCYTYTLII